MLWINLVGFGFFSRGCLLFFKELPNESHMKDSLFIFHVPLILLQETEEHCQL